MEWFTMKAPRTLLRIAVDEIVYVKADANYCDIILINGESYKIQSQLGKFEQYFQSLEHADWFIRVGKSLIVNYQYIRIINLNNRTIVLGGKHLVNKPRKGIPQAMQQESGEIGSNLYTLTASLEALSSLKEKLESIINRDRK